MSAEGVSIYWKWKQTFYRLRTYERTHALMLLVVGTPSSSQATLFTRFFSLKTRLSKSRFAIKCTILFGTEEAVRHTYLLHVLVVVFVVGRVDAAAADAAAAAAGRGEQLILRYHTKDGITLEKEGEGLKILLRCHLDL